MIAVRILSGPYAGQSRTDRQVMAVGTTPMDLLADLVKRNVDWKVDYPAGEWSADRVEADPTLHAWVLADVVARIVRAASKGRPVLVLGRLWEFPPTGSPAFVARLGELEDQIGDSGRVIVVVSDDEHGVVLGSPE